VHKTGQQKKSASQYSFESSQKVFSFTLVWLEICTGKDSKKV